MSKKPHNYNRGVGGVDVLDANTLQPINMRYPVPASERTKARCAVKQDIPFFQ
ncbi:MAG: hypothetical protein JW913_02100 [Chitinispirillaceae bacterium]|nr:hypothetical protein [Chitinispirillaceae bacterium]